MIAAAIVARLGTDPDSLRRVRSYYCAFGVTIGLSAALVLALVVHNKSSAAWALWSAVMSAFALREARKDDGPVPRTFALFVSSMSLLVSASACLGYVVFSARDHQGLSATGNYVDAVWAFVSAKWSLTLAFYAWQRHLHQDYTPLRANMMCVVVLAAALGLCIAMAILLTHGDVEKTELPWLACLLLQTALLVGELRVGSKHYLLRSDSTLRSRATMVVAAVFVLAGSLGATASGVRMAETSHTLFDGSDSQAGAALSGLCAVTGYVLGYNAGGNFLLLESRHRLPTLQEDALSGVYAELDGTSLPEF